MKHLTTILISMMLITAQSAFAGDHFTTKKDRLVDANGKSFVIKGINNPHAWFGERAYTALDDIAAIGSNTVRVVWQTRGNDAELERIIQRCIELKMVPMVELHDVTGNTSGNRLVQMAEWYIKPDRMQMLKKYEKYLLLNIANEWGDNAMTTDYWVASYKRAISLMRWAGYQTTIVIDGPGWGQNINPIIEGGKALIEADPLHNILFSIHMYGSWNDPEKIRRDLGKCKSLKLPLIVGEFGYNSDNGNNNLGCKADHTVILETCNKLGYGFMPWSWTGNNAENQWLDLVDNKDWKTLTWWGKQVIEAKGGVTDTARKASIFK